MVEHLARALGKSLWFLQLMSSTNRMPIRIVFTVMCMARLLATSFGAAGVDLNNPTALAFDHSGDLFIADHTAQTIFKLTPDGTRSVFLTGVRLSDGNGLAFDA